MNIKCDNCGYRWEEDELPIKFLEYLETMVGEADVIDVCDECQAEIYLDSKRLKSINVTDIEISKALKDRLR